MPPLAVYGRRFQVPVREPEPPPRAPEPQPPESPEPPEPAEPAEPQASESQKQKEEEYSGSGLRKKTLPESAHSLQDNEPPKGEEVVDAEIKSDDEDRVASQSYPYLQPTRLVSPFLRFSHTVGRMWCW